MEGSKFLGKDGKPAKCEGCKAPVVAKYCGECGLRTLDDGGKVIGNDGWGPGSKVKRDLKLPKYYTAFNQRIHLFIQGRKIPAGSIQPLDADTFNAWRQQLKARREGDLRSVHGEPGAKKHLDVFLGSVRGRQ